MRANNLFCYFAVFDELGAHLFVLHFFHIVAFGQNVILYFMHVFIVLHIVFGSFSHMPIPNCCVRNYLCFKRFVVCSVKSKGTIQFVSSTCNFWQRLII